MPLSAFRDVVPDEHLRFDAPLSEYSTMRVGGPADLLISPASEEEIHRVLEAARQTGTAVCVLGNGSNMLFSDEGFRGVVLHLGKAFCDIALQGECLTAQAGALLPAVSRFAAENALSGMEFAAGIPGSVGGAVCMNAGAYGGEISQVLTQARVYRGGNLETWDIQRMQYGYRHSAVMAEDCVVLSAAFRLMPGDKAAIEARMADFNQRRREKQPLQYPSCGSFFKRPAGHFAGALIEQAGLKGYAVGDAQVSELHAGFLINRGHATAAQVYQLMLHVQKKVYDRFGVMLEPEVKLMGRFET